VQARYQVAALREVRPLTEIRVFDIDAQKADAFARENRSGPARPGAPGDRGA
jgi:ornithine cyclodeaminase/alanine dehydrogenase-like protein (mu-crystallin family)